MFIFPVQLTTSRIGNLTRLIHTLLYVMTIHKYIRYSTRKEMDAAAEIGRNPVSKHQIQPEYRDDQADTGRDCRTLLGRPNS